MLPQALRFSVSEDDAQIAGGVQQLAVGAHHAWLPDRIMNGYVPYIESLQHKRAAKNIFLDELHRLDPKTNPEDAVK